MSGQPREIGRYLVPEVSEARLARQYSVIRERAPRQTPPLVRRAALCLLVLCSLVAGALVLRASGGHGLDGTTVRSGAGAGQVIELTDGSRVALGADSRVRLARVSADEVRLTLERGSLDADVTHRPRRAFLVEAGGYRVRVVGTKFSVALGHLPGESRVEVRVERGRVEVADTAGSTRALDAGESWRSAASGGSSPDGATAGAQAPSLPTDEPSASAWPPASAEPPQAASSAPTSASAPPASQAAASEPAPAPGPKELLEAAQVARAAGRPREAASAYDALRRRFRGDGRAALAAFELGRLRMDALGDMAGAIEALSDAIALSPGGPFREDAEARRVQAMARAGRGSQCRQAREAYLARYPRGVHRAVVDGLCGGP